ncbi:putative Gnk2-like domain-containing protein [Arabidopsis thaliana]
MRICTTNASLVKGNISREARTRKTLIISSIISLSIIFGTVSDTAHGEAPNSGNFVFQCRGDSYGSICGSCYATAVAGLRKRCQRYKGAIIWYDQCFLKVSTINSPPTKMDYENTFPMHNPNNINGDTQLFNQKMKNFLYELALKADKPKADGTGLLYYAAGTKRLGKNKLYAMVQCTLDIFHCKVCLEWSIKELSKCCEGKQGARVLGTSCNVRYELYPFIRT